jgi:hypothetical protein
MEQFRHTQTSDHAEAAVLTENGAERMTGTQISWDSMYAAARRQYQEHGTLDVPGYFVCPDGVRLGAWLAELRRIRAGLADGILTDDQIRALDEIGMVWSVSDFGFERNYHAAALYYREHGDLECDADYVDSAGVKLGAWLAYLRSQYKKRGRYTLTEEQFRMLDAIGMRWGSKHDKQWEVYFRCLVSYRERTGNTDVPATWKENGVQLGRWLRRQKDLYAGGELRQDRVQRLQALGLAFDQSRHELAWERHFQAVKRYTETSGDTDVPKSLKDTDGVDLRRWVQLQNAQFRKGQLLPEKAERLRSLGLLSGNADAADKNRMMISDPPREIQKTENPCAGNVVNR